jgi:hypothetical protein
VKKVVKLEAVNPWRIAVSENKLTKFLISSRITDGVLSDQIARELYKLALESCGFAIIVTEVKLKKLYELRELLKDPTKLNEFLTNEE